MAAQARSRPRATSLKKTTEKPQQFKCLPTIEFDSNEVRDAFSAAVVKALLEHDRCALECRGAP
jgi:hypothetical protein